MASGKRGGPRWNREGGVDELMVGSIVLGFEDRTGLGDVGDGALNDGEDFGVKEVGHLGWGLVEGMGFDA
ncbi:hypothetical protein DVH24_024118 [Malus domestica]|uniref:Uncharacterized protein n=1 Tax=Malus domestica TaxID=3750 RepID=A0A498JKH5_MALDO|nr:hypothetical protein DVH24_024118 [Malus domestica]